MNVVYVSADPGVPVFGRKGSSVHAQAVLRELVRGGASIDLVSTRVGEDVPLDLTGVRTHAVPVDRTTGDVAARERALQAADATIADLLDRLHAQDGIDLVYERYSLWGTAAMEWASRAGVPSVLEVNAPLVVEQAAHRELADAATAQRCARASITAASAVIAVSAPVARWAAEQTADPSRVHVVRNGVDTRRIQPRLTGHRPAAVTIGFVGTLKPWHGVGQLVRAVATIRGSGRDVRLLVVGDGPQRGALTEMAADLGIARSVEFTGALPPAQVLPHLHGMDIAVAPYPHLADFYFSPLKVYEYLAAGLPVVASALGEIPEVLEHGRTGVLVPPGDVDALARALTDLADDPGERDRLGARARHAATTRHDWGVVVTTALGHAGVRWPPSIAQRRTVAVGSRRG